MSKTPDHEALRSYEHGPPPDVARPAQKWCPICRLTLIDPVVEALCLDCEAAGSLIVTKDLQSEDR